MNIKQLHQFFISNSGRMKRAANAGLVITSGLLVMRLSAFAMSILVARLSGASVFGEFTLFITVFILASEIPHSFDTAYLRATGTSTNHNEKHFYEHLNFASKLVLLVSIALVLFLTKDLIGTAIGKPMAGDIIAWAALCGGINSLYMLLAVRAQQRRDHRKVAILKPVYNLLILTLTIIAISVGAGLTIQTIYYIYLLVGISLAVASLATIWRSNILTDENTSLIKPYLSVSMALFLSTALALIGNRIDVFVLGYYLDFEQLGVYGVALRIAIVVSLMTAAMSTIMIPRAAEAHTSIKKFKKYLALGGFYIAIQIVCAAILILLIEPLIVFLFGDSFLSARLPAAILIGQVLLNSMGIPFQALVQCGPRPSRMIYISLIKVIVSVPLMLSLVPQYGVTGAAISVATISLIMTIFLVWLALKYRPITE